MEDDPHAQIEARLRRARQRYTHGRRDLVEVLVAADRPLTIPEILEHSAALRQSSVYRNLQLLEQSDAVRRIVHGDDSGARFELAEGLMEHHHHLICQDCGAISDFRPSPQLETSLAGLVDEAGDQGDFVVDHHRFDLVGTCADCT